MSYKTVADALQSGPFDPGAQLHAQWHADHAWWASCPSASPSAARTSGVPLELDRADTDHWFIYQGRLKPGVTLKQVEADLLPIAQRWAKDHPKDYPKRFTIEASSYVDSIVGPFRKTLFTLGAAVALLLLIACANVANMLLARIYGARPRDGDPRRAGREPVASGAATSGGESDACAGRRGAGLRLRVCGNQSAGDGDSGRRDSARRRRSGWTCRYWASACCSPSSPRCCSGLRRRCNWRAAILSSR